MWMCMARWLCWRVCFVTAPAYLPCLAVCLSVWLSVCLYVLSLCLSVRWSFRLSVYLPACQLLSENLGYLFGSSRQNLLSGVKIFPICFIFLRYPGYSFNPFTAKVLDGVL